jgi:hypothetical protein
MQDNAAPRRRRGIGRRLLRCQNGLKNAFRRAAEESRLGGDEVRRGKDIAGHGHQSAAERRQPICAI